jgi:dienelactone hydrolase
MSWFNRRTAGYLRGWLGTPSGVVEDQLTLVRGKRAVAATLVRPEGRRPAPTWVVLHGMTRPGREHPQLVRFTHALAAAGVASIVPDVPEWRDLRLRPELTKPTVKAAIGGLRDADTTRHEHVGVIGFSFGAPHAIAVAGDPDLSEVIAGAAGFGGYCSLEPTFRFMMTGHHGAEVDEHYLRPDPYGRWIVGGNFLTAVDEFRDAGVVADALNTLATEAAVVGATSWDPIYDPLIRRLREGVSQEWQPLFDQFAPLSTATRQDTWDARWLGNALAEAAKRVNPAIDPEPALRRVRRPVAILHGRRDHLIPWTEAARLNAAVGATSHATVTRMFGHTSQDPFPILTAFAEVPLFCRALSRMLATV